MTRTAVRVLVDGLVFPECLRVRPDGLWFSDYGGDAVWHLPANTLAARQACTLPTPAGLGWSDGQLLAVESVGRRVLRLVPLTSSSDVPSAETWCDLSEWMAHPANELVSLPDGRHVVGGFGFQLGTEPRESELLVLDDDGRLIASVAGLCFPNGMARIGRHLVVAETFADRLAVIDLDTTTVTARLALPSGSRPDGLDERDGVVAVACPGLGEILAVDSAGATRVLVAQSDVSGGVPNRTVYDCGFGGDANQLFMALADEDDEGAMARRDGAVAGVVLTSPGLD